jgi:hypothetical protein
MGVISGADQDRWNTAHGLWSDSNLVGSVEALGQDYKSLAWINLDVSSSEVLLERRYGGLVQGQVVLGQACLKGVSRLRDLFGGESAAPLDTTLACPVSEIRALRGSATGLSSTTFVEGMLSGLGGPDTNGFCWNGGDTVNNTFSGHLVWNQSAYASTCAAEGHFGGIAVYAASVSYTTADITGTNWLGATDFSLTAIRLYARTVPSVAIPATP